MAGPDPTEGERAAGGLLRPRRRDLARRRADPGRGRGGRRRCVPPGCTVGFMSNNSSVPVGEVAAKLGRFGIDVAPRSTCSRARWRPPTCSARPMPPPARACWRARARAWSRRSLTRATRSVTEGPADAVVVGFHRDFDFDGLERAADAVRAGARFVATNLDATYPIPGGLLPGAGSIVAAVATAIGAHPRGGGQAGRAGGRRWSATASAPAGVMVGDRPTTDGALRRRSSGWPFALVLSGVAPYTPGPGEEPVPDPPPPFVAADLLALVPSLVAALVPA